MTYSDSKLQEELVHVPQLNRPVLATLTISILLAACGGSADDGSALSGGATAEPPGALAAESTEAKANAPEPEAMTSETEASSFDEFGEPLEDPQRYYGLYANPDSPNRAWFVTEAERPAYAEQAPEVPPGHLMIGAMFGDVSPWYLRALSETEFEQIWVSDFQPAPVTIEFELDGEGKAVALRFTSEGQASEGRLVRQGDLPEGF